jgi:hypothetical protein
MLAKVRVLWFSEHLPAPAHGKADVLGVMVAAIMAQSIMTRKSAEFCLSIPCLVYHHIAPSANPFLFLFVDDQVCPPCPAPAPALLHCTSQHSINSVHSTSTIAVKWSQRRVRSLDVFPGLAGYSTSQPRRDRFWHSQRGSRTSCNLSWLVSIVVTSIC